MASYQIFTDSSSDLTRERLDQYGLDYFRFGLVVDGGIQYNADLDWKEYTQTEFYGWLSAGRKIKTTQLSLEEAINRMTPYLEKGIDIFYLCCSSALTGSLNLFRLAVDELKEKYPERKFVGIDSLSAATSLGMMAMDAAKKRDEGLTIEELEAWAESHKLYYNYYCTVDTLKYLKAAGRIKGTAAFFGDIAGVKPIFISDKNGNNLTIKKARGTKASMNELIAGAKATLMKEHCTEIFVGHGNCEARALDLAKTLEEELNIKCTVTWIGPIIGATCGPGVLAVFTRGKEVTRFEGDGVTE